MKYYLIAGEASGDLHGSNLIKELFKKDPSAEIHCWGGNMMQSAGGTLIKHYRDLAFMGFAEVIKNLPTIFSNLRFCKKDISRFKPDVIVFIDYPGFNMRIAKWAKQNRYRTAWYISPQIWAWKESRVHAIKRDVERMLVILPFEKTFYKKYNYDVTYTGHPLIKVVHDWKNEHRGIQKENIIALLPGSRTQEISIKLPIMLQVARSFPDYKFVVAKAPSLSNEFYDEMLKAFPSASAVTNDTYTLLSRAKAALVTSGTATLETALFNVPQVICYKGSRLSYEIAKRVIKIKFIGLANLIMNRELVKELIQNELTPQNLEKELKSLLQDEEQKAKIQKGYEELYELLSAHGDASAKAAESITELSRISVAKV